MIYELIRQEIYHIFGTSVDWLSKANDIFSYIVTTGIFLLYLIIPIIIFMAFISLGTLLEPSTARKRKKR